jgi:beta-xylosidase
MLLLPWARARRSSGRRRPRPGPPGRRVMRRPGRGAALVVAPLLLAGAAGLAAVQPASADVVSGTVYTVSNAAAGRALDEPGGQTANGTALEIWDANGGANQQWRFSQNSDGTFTVTNLASGRVLDEPGGQTANGTRMEVWDSNGGANQHWRVSQNSDGSYTLVNVTSGRALQTPSGQTANGTPVQIWDSNGGANQHWNLSPAGGTTPPPNGQYSNPVLWEDLADADVFRVGDTFYYSASTMHYSPGAPILRSYDLVHWEFAGHSVPSLDFGAKYDLNGNGRAYINGVWASFLNYRKSNGKFYWGGCIDFNKTYIYTASSVEGPWTRGSVINNCYYDAGMMVDDNDTMYVAYGSGTHYVAQLSADGLSQVRTQAVFTDPSSTGTTEGNRIYKVNGNYYILVDHPANAEYVLKSTNGPFGPYTEQPLLNNIGTPVVGGGVPHQGGIVQTQNGDWYYMAFVDSYPGGRIPVLAPITWNSSGWPVLQTVGGAWGTTYPNPNVPTPPREVKPPTGTDTFTGPALGPEWEWNHNPDNTKWSANNGLTLQTATVTNDLYSARNTLTHRILGPTSTATVQLDYSGMHDGDRAGLAMLRASSAWIGVKRDNGATRLVMTNNITMDGNWNTTSTGTEAASANISGGKIWLRVNADIHPGAGRQAHFSYSTDGTNFTPLGPGFVMDNSWQFFMGYRFALFNYATQALGGSVKVSSFDLATP